MPDPDLTNYRTRHSRTRKAVARAIRVLHMLRRRGVDTRVVGSLATGRWDEGWSDVDFLVLDCPYPLMYRIESGVEDILHDIRFDVSYLNEVRERVRTSMLAEMKDIPDLVGMTKS